MWAPLPGASPVPERIRRTPVARVTEARCGEGGVEVSLLLGAFWEDNIYIYAYI